jgi:hypothetical protein
MGANSGNIRAFDRDLKEIAMKVNIWVPQIVVKIALDLHTKFSTRNPVDTGRSRAGWDVKEGAPSDHLPPPGSYSGPKPINPGSFGGRDITFITNAVDYVEFLDAGSSKQAPGGIVDISVAEVMVEIDSFIAKITR